MMASRWLGSLALLALAAAAPGCVPTPADRCVQYEQEVQALLDRCGIPRRFQVVDADGAPVCGAVRQVMANYNELPNVCYPFLESADCSTIDPADPLATFPPECSASHFEYRR